MGLINVLDISTANLIAAGEVVERPASAIKELLENCADAGATKVTVEIKNGGSTYIRVTDNGCGMAKDDVPTSILRHATSKIKSGDDLAAIGTLGFRGEALAAIAAVTRLSIMTKRRDDKSGTLFEAEFGEAGELSETGCPDGTTIIARNLFENVPARRKFLKKDATESQAVLAAAEKFALSKPYIAVSMISDGIQKLRTPGDGVVSNTVYAALGRDFAEGMMLADYNYGGISVNGYICKPQFCRANRSMQNFFINERYVRSKTVCAALEEGFRSYCPIGKFPGAVLYIKINCELVDVNIHPAKLEVKFVNEKAIFDAVYYSVRNALVRGTSGGFNLHGIHGGERPERSGNPVSLGTLQEVFPPSDISDKQNSVFIDSENESDKDKTIHSTSPPVFDASKADSPLIHEISAYPPPESDDSKENGIFSRPLPSADSAEHMEFIKNLEISIPNADVATSKKNETPASDGDEASVPDFPPLPSAISDCELNNGKDPTATDSADPHRPPAKPLAETLSMLGEDSDGDTGISDRDELARHIKKGVSVIGEAFNSYIIVEAGGVLYLIDKHAAHERIIYEGMKNGKGDGGIQLLLEPVSVAVSSKESEAITEHGEYLQNAGFVFEEFGANTYLLRGLPPNIEISDAKELFTFLAGRLADGNGRALGDIFDRALYTSACKAAVKAGMKTSTLSNTVIIDKLFSDESVLYCPHGRPVIIEFSKSKLDRMFGRT